MVRWLPAFCIPACFVFADGATNHKAEAGDSAGTSVTYYALDVSLSVPHDIQLTADDHTRLRWTFTVADEFHYLAFTDVNGNVRVEFEGSFQFGEPDGLHWKGVFNGEEAEGTLVTFEGDQGGIALVFERGGETEPAVYFEMNPAWLPLVGMELGDDARGPKCVCWPPQGVACTTAECNESDNCGCGGVCMWRWILSTDPATSE